MTIEAHFLPIWQVEERNYQLWRYVCRNT